MSTEFNEWDWNNTDWNNGWTNNTVSQNFNRPPPKEASTTSQINQHNRGSTTDFYDKGWEDWTSQNYGPEVRGHTSSSLYSTINNNNTLNQVENREIAPPDNKNSYESSKFKSKAPDISNRASQHLNNVPLSSKIFPPQPIQQSGVKVANHINDYFDSNPINQSTSSQPKFYTQPVPGSFNAQVVTSGPSSYTNAFQPHQQTEQEMGFSSLEHHVNLTQQSVIQQMPPKDEGNHNVDNRSRRFTPSPQQRNAKTSPVLFQPPMQTHIPHPAQPPIQAHIPHPAQTPIQAHIPHPAQPPIQAPPMQPPIQSSIQPSMQAPVQHSIQPPLQSLMESTKQVPMQPLSQPLPQTPSQPPLQPPILPPSHSPLQASSAPPPMQAPLQPPIQSPLHPPLQGSIQNPVQSPTLQPHNTLTNHHVTPSSEIHDVNDLMKFNPNLGNLPSYQSSNIITPLAASSPVVRNSHLPDNQERIPENREYPDNTENIAQDLKALSIKPTKEVEQETQKHCAIDRNQYLETGQFSSRKETNTYLQNTDINDEGEAPPPGLHRLVTGQGCEPWGVEVDNWLEKDVNQTPATPSGPSLTRHSSPLTVSSIGESETREGDKDRRREVPGEAEPLQGRVVLGQVPTPPQDVLNSRGDREREGLERMVVGEQGQSGNTSDDYRQPGRQIRHQRHRRTDSSYEEEERDYSSDRDRRNEDHRRREDRTRRRREHRSPEYRSDEEYEDRRGYHRNGRESRRMRDYSPDRSYYRDYYRGEESRARRYYGREYDDYYRENQRSRPSSRSGSDYRHQMKHSMRVIPGHYYHDPYAAAAPNFHDYNLKYSQRTADYFETMRHVDPAGYAAWYSQYMQGRFIQESSGRAFSSDRASVHSGQSSSNQRHGISTPQDTVDDVTREEEVDYTPRLYDSAHIRGNMDGHGRLVIVDPHYPLDNQRGTVNICRLSQVALDKDSEDFFQSPGPFIPGVTHRNTVLQYLKRISDRSVKSSEKLLYDLIHMTVKGNGEVNGSDVAELLLESYKKSIQNGNELMEDATSSPTVSSKEITSRFRELLQQGNKAEALDWAIDNEAWGHALFLASKMDERTHNNIMLRFANSIPHNDPLQTLYQLMSGYIPQAATCCSDKKWSDWRPHLAMILSNPTGNSNLDRQAIITLGDSLSASGRLYASHFCYVTAQIEFSQFRPDAKLVLLGSSPNQEFSKFASCRAIMLTMCYEYGLKLRQPTFNIPTLQVYKLILAARLIDSGRIRNALQYCELLAQEMLGGSALLPKSLVTTVIDFSSRLKMFDPVLALSGDTDEDPDWLANLKHLFESLPDEYAPGSNNCSPLTIPEPNSEAIVQETYKVTGEQQNIYPEPIPIVNTMVQGFQPQVPISQVPGRPQYQNEVPDDMYLQGFVPPPSISTSTPLGYQTGQGGNNETPGSIEITSGPEQQWEPQRVQPSIIQQPSTETSQVQRNSFFKATEEQLKLNEVGGDRKKEAKVSENKTLTKNEEQGGGWFGGIWGKISMRPKNQMRLPDDNNPSIIWDEKKKKWVNLDGETESGGSVKPPPKVSEYVPPQGSNKYKLQKGKLMKSNYVDVMGNTEKTDASKPPNMVPSMPPVMKANYFVPPPVEGNENAPIDFISPAPSNPVISADPSENSKQQTQGNLNPPTMYNPSRFPS